MIIKMCFTKSINHDIGRFSIISNSYILLSIILSFMLLNIFLSRLISKKSKMRTAEGYQNKMKVERRLNYYVDKVFSNVNFGKDIRIFQMQDYILSLYEDTLNASISFYNKFYHETIKNKESLNKIIMFIAQLSAYTLIIFKVYFKSISIGTMSRYIGVLYMFNNSINELIDINQKISLQSSFIEVFDELLNLPNKKESGNRKISSIKNNRYIIEFHNVSYRYENSKDFALKNISYSFRFNSKFGIVGKNGSGKTTLIKLLTRLYDPTDGYITLNGIDIRQFKYEDYLSLFSIVFQDYQLFAFPISVNISANLHPNIEKVRFAISEVGMSDKVDKLANKENTSLFKMEKDGINFSAGELQKLAIARAIYKDSPIAIFDEPTAALDPESEYEIFKNMSQLINRRAGVFISHRMGSCRFCDNILVLDKGRIVQIGSHEELLKDRSKLYYKLYSTQANHYIE